MRETCTYGSMRGIRRKTAKHVLRVAEGRAGVPDNKGRPALLYTLLYMFYCICLEECDWISRQFSRQFARRI